MKKIILCMALAVVILSIGILPEQMISNITHYSMVKPVLQEYQPQITCNGYVVAREGVKLIVNSNVVVKKLWVESGSWVTAGQVVAETTPPDRMETFLSQSLDAPKAQINPDQLEALAAQYGMEVPTDSREQPSAGQMLSSSTLAQSKEAIAPISGTLTWNAVSEGRFLPAGSLFCTILGLDRYEAKVQVPAVEVDRIVLGAKAHISGSEIAGQNYEGTVTAIGNSISREVTSGGYSSVTEVVVTVDAPIDSMRHGAGITCSIETGSKEALLTLPYEAIHQDNQNNEYVYCAVNHVLKKQFVKTGIELEDTIQITHGITAQNLIAAEASEKLQERYVLELPIHNATSNK